MRREREHETQIDRTNAISVIKMQREVLLRVEWKFNQLSLGAEESRLGQDRSGWLGSHPTHPLACVINFTSFPYQIKLQFHIELSSH